MVRLSSSSSLDPFFSLFVSQLLFRFSLPSLFCCLRFVSARSELVSFTDLCICLLHPFVVTLFSLEPCPFYDLLFLQFPISSASHSRVPIADVHSGLIPHCSNSISRTGVSIFQLSKVARPPSPFLSLSSPSSNAISFN